MDIYKKYMWAIVLIISGSIGILIGTTVYSIYSSQPAPETRQSSDFDFVLRYQYPELYTSKNQPTYTIKSVKKIGVGWYLLNIQDVTNTNQNSYIVVNDKKLNTNNMLGIAGPNNKFSVAELNNIDELPYTIKQAILHETGSKEVLR